MKEMLNRFGNQVSVHISGRVSVGLLMLLLLPVYASAQVGGASGIQSRLFMSSFERALGSVVTSSSYTENPLYVTLNPSAARSQGQQWSALMQTSTLPFDRSHHRLSLQAPLDERLGIRIHLGQYRVGDIDGRSISGYPTQTYSTSESMVGVQFGLSITETLDAGLGISWHHSSLYPDLDAATTIGLDVGLQSRITDRYTWMVVAKDLLASYRWTTGSLSGANQEGSIRQRFERRYIFGHTIALQSVQFHHSVTLSTQTMRQSPVSQLSDNGLIIRQSTETNARAVSTSFGLDWAAHSQFRIQLGVHSTPFSEIETSWKGSGGFLLDLPDVPLVNQFHYALWSEHPDIGFAHTFSLTFSL